MSQHITNGSVQSTGRTPQGYLAKLKGDPSTPRLLVEGKYDRIFFEKLIDCLIPIQTDPNVIKLLNDIRDAIDCAEIINTTGGNRERVEAICQLVDNEPATIQFIGFVDREYRNFDIPNNFVDQLKCHNQIGSSIWTYGHSLENYFFDIALLSDVYNDYMLKAKTDRSIARQALRAFAQYFERSLYHALCLAMVAYDLGIENKKMAKTIIATCFDISTGSLQFNETNWLPVIAGKSGQSSQTIRLSLNQWQQKLDALSISCYREVCHGHITERTLFNVFLAIIDYRVSQHTQLTQQNIRNIRSHIENKGSGEGERFIDYSNRWIAMQFWTNPESPILALKKLGLP